MSDIHGMYEPFMRRIRQLNDLESVKAGEDRLILLGDYIDVGHNSFKVLRTIYDLQLEAGADNMVVLMGNHDKWFIDFLAGRNDYWLSDPASFAVLEVFLTSDEMEELNRIINHTEPGRAKSEQLVKYINDCLSKEHGDLIRWYKRLPLYYRTDTQIFVHAGVDEAAEDWWETGTSDEMFLEKYPPTKGRFYMDIIAGHVSTSMVSGDRNRHDIYYDGASHFYIDGIDAYPNNVRDEERVIPLLEYVPGQGRGQYFSLQEDGSRTMLRTNRSRAASGRSTVCLTKNLF